MRKLKVYLDTSIINFVNADDAPEYMKITRDFFDNYIDEYDIYISEIVLLEIEKTSKIERKTNLRMLYISLFLLFMNLTYYFPGISDTSQI